MDPLEEPAETDIADTHRKIKTAAVCMQEALNRFQSIHQISVCLISCVQHIHTGTQSALMVFHHQWPS